MQIGTTVLTILILCFKALAQANCPSRPVSEAEQRTIFNEFVQTFLVAKDANTALNEFFSEDYINHNPFVAQGRQAAIDFLVPFIASGVNFTIINSAASGDRGIVHYRLDQPGQSAPSAVADVYRFDAGGSCIREHWDVIEMRPANATNPIALF